jgi:hypothetical protein
MEVLIGYIDEIESLSGTVTQLGSFKSGNTMRTI